MPEWEPIMKTFVKPGDVITLVAPAALVSGQLFQSGKIVGVATSDAASGAQVETLVEGVVTLPKTPADAIVQGQALKALATGTVDSTGTILFGYAVSAAAAGSTTVRARLVPSAA
jgi:predicted RecA/RadA family phage recombinase